MKLSHTRPSVLLLLLLLICCACLIRPGEARGGRGRGGGSFGGLFGGWRSKYGSKSSSSSGGRRVVSGSPVHTAMNVPKVPPPPPPPPKPMPKPQIPSYPRQQLPPGYSYAAPPAAGTFYANAQALPAGALYYAQPPSSMGSGTSGFLTGMLAGRLMDSVLFGHRHHVSHVYHQNPQGEAAAATNGREIIVINNGQQQQQQQQEGGEAAAAAPTEVTLNEPQSPQNPLTGEDASSSQQQETADFSTDLSESTAPPEIPVGNGGIVCFPIRLNETDPQQPEVQREVERIVCFPAPNPADCQNNPECLHELGISTTSTEPPIVAGDIGGSLEDAGSDNPAVSSAAPEVNGKLDYATD